MPPTTITYIDYYEEIGIDDDDNNQKDIVDAVSRIVNEASKSMSTISTSIDQNVINNDFGAVDGALSAISGNGGDSVFHTIIGETVTEAIQEITTENIEKATQFPTKFEIATEYYSVFTKVGMESHHDDSVSHNTPYIILVVVLAVLVAVTIIALALYQKRRSNATVDKNPTDVTVTGKAFSKTELEQTSQTPQQIMYGEN